MPDGNSGTRIGTRLARGDDVTDDEVDALYPDWIVMLSRLHWTPVNVARSAARFLADTPAPRILDVGAGAGKFAAVAAATTGASVTGIERRPSLVAIAREFARKLGADTATFAAGQMEALDWSSFTGIYFFNPFGEHFIEEGEAIDADRHAGWSHYVHYVRSALARLYLMPIGTRVATFHGIGAPLPSCYELVGGEPFDTGVLRFFVRRDPLLLEIPRIPADVVDDTALFDEITAEMRADGRKR